MTEWTPQDDWSQVTHDDPIRVVSGLDAITGRVSRLHLYPGDTRVRAIDIESVLLIEPVTVEAGQGWQLSVPAKPAVELPTEPGAYATNSGDVTVLNKRGAWLDFSMWSGSEWNPDVNHHMPLTKLEPVAVTAKKVLDAIEARWSPGDMRVLSYAGAAQIAKEFGVTE